MQIVKKRDLSFDFIKGLLIYLVVYGHVLANFESGFLKDLVFVWIYSFHMPLFILISGYFATNTLQKGLEYTVRTRFSRLLVPALLWSVLQFFFIHCYDIPTEGLFRAFYNSMRGVWFLYCLFVVYVLTSLIWQTKYRYWWALAGVTLGYISYPYHPIDVIKHFQIIQQWPLFLLGAFYAQSYICLHTQMIKHKNLWCCIFILCSALYALHIYLIVNGDGTYEEARSYYLIHGLMLIMAALLYFVFLKGLYQPINKWGGVIMRIICQIGKYTLGIYVIHFFVITFIKHSMFANWVQSFPYGLFSILVLVISYFLTRILQSNKFIKKYLLGER